MGEALLHTDFAAQHVDLFYKSENHTQIGGFH
jgi:hypothetical protein